MNPFETPPTTPLVSSDPPSGPATPRRGRMALVALGTAGLLAGGIVGVSALASADDPELDSATALATVDDEAPNESPDEDSPDDGAPDDDSPDDAAPDDESDQDPVVDGEIVIDLGDGDPIEIDLGELMELDDQQLTQLQECVGLPLIGDEFAGGMPMFDLPFGDGELPPEFEELFDEFATMFDDFEFDDFEFDEFEDFELGEIVPPLGDLAPIGDGQVHVLGPDGVTVIDLGDGAGSVTVTRDGETGEVTITTDGTATEQSLEELFGESPAPEELEELFGELPAPEELEELFGDVFDMIIDDGFAVAPIDPDVVADCLEDLG